MTQKDYIAMAEALKAQRPNDDGSDEHRQWARDVTVVARVFAADNVRFDHDIFYEAAGC